MTVSFVQATAAGTVDNTAVTTNSCNVPAGTTDGDVMVATCTTTQTITVTTPTGWTAAPAFFNASTGVRMYGFWRIASTEPASYAFAHTSGAVFTINILTFRGVDNTNPVRTTATATGASATTVTSGTLTGQAATDMVVICAGERPEATGANVLATPTGGWTAPAAAKASDGSTSGFKSQCSASYLINGSPAASTTTTASGIAVASYALRAETAMVTASLMVNYSAIHRASRW